MDHEQIGNKEIIKWRRMTKNYNSKLDKKRMHHMQLDYKNISNLKLDHEKDDNK